MKRHITLSTRFSGQAGEDRYACHLITAGELTGHGLKVDLETLSENLDAFLNLNCLLNHADWWLGPQVENLIGVFERVYLDDEGVAAELVLKRTPAARVARDVIEVMLEDVQAGRPTFDVGLSLDCWVTLGEKDDDGLRPIESFVDVSSADLVFRPASDGARVSARLSRILSSLKEVQMTDDVQVVAREPANAGPDAVSEYLSAMAMATLEAKLGASGLPAAMQESIRQRFAGQAPTVAVMDAVIDEQRGILAELSENYVIRGFDSPRDAGRVSVHDPLDEAVNAVNWLFGVSDAKLPRPELRKFDQLYVWLSGDWEWHGRTVADRVRFASATTTTLAALAVNAMNKVIVETWDTLAMYRWFEQLVTVQPNDGSIHDMQWITFGGIGDLPTVDEGAAYTELTVDDKRESSSFTKKGGYVGITLEMIRNSQIQRIRAVPRALAVAAVRTRSNAIAGIFTSNAGVGPTMSDGNALFSAAHNNLDTVAFDANGWKAARIECAKQTELNSGKRLMLWPKFALVPPDLYDDALVVFGYGAGGGGWPGTANNDVNPYGMSRPGDPRPVPVAVPEFTDTNDWAYLADPGIQPILQMSYAQAPGGGVHPVPELFEVTDPRAGLQFTNDVLPIKVRDWFAAGVSDWRGIGKRNVV